MSYLRSDDSGVLWFWFSRRTFYNKAKTLLLKFLTTPIPEPLKPQILFMNLNLNRTEFGDARNTGNVLSESEALGLLESWVPNERLRLHMKQVAAVMKAWALEREGLPETEAYKWWLAGLLHDADWEKHPDQHCRVIIEELERRKVDPAVIRCIASHGPRHFGVEPESKMDKMIYVFDELSGFIHAAALIRPTRYEGMDVKSVLKKLKTPSFAAQVNREEIQDALGRTSHSLEEIIEFILKTQPFVA
jgi:predicted hydrolase (HD superfamily)